MAIIIFAILLILILLIALIPLVLVFVFIFGPPYLPTPKNVIKEMFEIVNIDRDDVVVDLGSGDGAVLIEAALRGAIAEGWEINPYLVLLTKLKARIMGLHNRISVYAKPYQKANLKQATVIFCYCMPKFMPVIENKLRKEAQKNVKIVSYKFPIPNLIITKQTQSRIFLYKNLKK